MNTSMYDKKSKIIASAEGSRITDIQVLVWKEQSTPGIFRDSKDFILQVTYDNSFVIQHDGTAQEIMALKLAYQTIKDEQTKTA